ncbi:MAG: hypothetical protein U0521_10930 [Anaerolineae bacterium]
MSIAVIGLNHRTAPVEIREKLMLSGDALHSALEDLRERTTGETISGSQTAPAVDEAVIVSTCNRLKSTLLPRCRRGVARVEQFIAELQGVSLAALKAYLYVHAGDDATRHLMRVACGLDSMILGETQVLGQVTRASSRTRIMPDDGSDPLAPVRSGDPHRQARARKPRSAAIRRRSAMPGRCC